MKRFWIVIFLVAVGTLLFFGLKSRKGTRSPGPSPVVAETNRPSDRTVFAPALARPSFQAKNPADISGPPALRAASPGAPTTNETVDLSPRAIVENVRSAIRLYGATFGGNPVGTNPEITGELAGNNPKQINFIGNDSGVVVNTQGELVDFWGTPFFFHQLSGSETEIRSAGPDKRMWTSDDLVVK